MSARGSIIAISALFVACDGTSDTSDPHEMLTCRFDPDGGSGPMPEQDILCDRACREPPPHNEPACAPACPSDTFTWEGGARGCCVFGPGTFGAKTKFVECE